MSALPEIPGYEVEAEIGRGGMGVVYRVRDLSKDIVRALKMLHLGRGATFAELARFRIEAEAHACLNHPNILKIRDVGLCGGFPYLVLEFAGGGSLQSSITSQKWTPKAAAELVRTVALAMQHAHERGMLHRDLKPANVLLMEDGTPKVSDFGLVKFANPIREVSEAFCTVRAPSMLDSHLSQLAWELGSQYRTVADAGNLVAEALTRSYWDECAARTGILSDETGLQSVREFLTAYREQSGESAPPLDDLTRDGSVMGSPHYMAPEQAAGLLAHIGPRTDVYSMGGILYELLAGRPPFRGNNLMELLTQAVSAPPVPPRQFAPDISADVEAICLKCLAKSPDERYESAAALAEDLARFLDGYAPRAVLAISAGGRPHSKGSNAKLPSTVAESIAFEGEPASTRSWWPFGKTRTRGGRSTS